GFVGAGLERGAQVLLERRGCGQRLAVRVVDDLRIDVLRGAVHREPRTATGASLERAAHARFAPRSLLVERRAHRRCPYFFLPSLRKTCSPLKRTPLPW